MALESSSQVNSKKNKIVVTGFGPFGPHVVNDSWECVKRLKETNIENELGVTLITKELPVVYANSEKEVPELWQIHNPDLMVHIGVHSLECLVVERVGKKIGYKKPDVSGSCPSDECCPIGEKAIISNTLNLDAIIHNVDTKGLEISISDNAGSYLCEYTYYLSLCQDSGRSIFIHIPPAGTAPSIEDKTVAIKNIIVSTYRHIKSQ